LRYICFKTGITNTLYNVIVNVNTLYNVIVNNVIKLGIQMKLSKKAVRIIF